MWGRGSQLICGALRGDVAVVRDDVVTVRGDVPMRNDVIAMKEAIGRVIPNIYVTLDISCHFGQCHKRSCFLLVRSATTEQCSLCVR